MEKIKKIVIFCLLLCSQKQALCFDQARCSDNHLLMSIIGITVGGVGRFCSDEGYRILTTTAITIFGITGLSISEQLIEQVLENKIIKKSRSDITIETQEGDQIITTRQVIKSITREKKSPLVLLAGLSFTGSLICFHVASTLNESIRK